MFLPSLKDLSVIDAVTHNPDSPPGLRHSFFQLPGVLATDSSQLKPPLRTATGYSLAQGDTHSPGQATSLGRLVLGYFKGTWDLFEAGILRQGFPGGSEHKEYDCNSGGLGSIPGSGRSFGEGNGNPLQYSCLENPMDRGAWQATVHGAAKSQTQLSNCTTITKTRRPRGDCHEARGLCSSILRNRRYGTPCMDTPGSTRVGQEAEGVRGK